MSTGNKHRTVIFYKDYFEKFFLKQRKKVKDKIVWTIELIEDLEIVPERYLKHIESTIGLYEMRVRVSRDSIRIFCFFDRERLVILINGFQKKTQKTPGREIQKAIKIMEEYKDERQK